MPYDVMIIDPPWPKNKGGQRSVRPNQGKELDYSTMSLEAIWKLFQKDILPSANADCNFFVWTVEEHLRATLSWFEWQNFKKHCTLIWNKENGVAPAFTVRYSHEYLIWYYKGKFSGVVDAERGKQTTVFSEKPREHSRKPEYVYTLLEKWFPNTKKLDVFSRQQRLGWSQYGDQTGYFTE